MWAYADGHLIVSFRLNRTRQGFGPQSNVINVRRNHRWWTILSFLHVGKEGLQKQQWLAVGCSGAGQSQQAAESLTDAVPAAGIAVRVSPSADGRLEVHSCPGPHNKAFELKQCTVRAAPNHLTGLRCIASLLLNKSPTEGELGILDSFSDTL